jgi:hypothetical protein
MCASLSFSRRGFFNVVLYVFVTDQNETNQIYKFLLHYTQFSPRIFCNMSLNQSKPHYSELFQIE